MRFSSSICGFLEYLSNTYLSDQYMNKSANEPQNSSIGIPPEYSRHTKIVLIAKALLDAKSNVGSSKNSLNYFWYLKFLILEILNLERIGTVSA